MGYDVEASFHDVFGRPSEHTGRAPGRVNLIGEHTDYSDGFVLPAAIPRETLVEVARSSDRRVRAFSVDVSPIEPLAYELGAEAKKRG